MRVLFWSPAFWPEIGGVQSFAAQLLVALRGQDYEFSVVTRQYASTLPARDTFHGIPVRRFPFRDVLASGKIDEMMEVRSRVAELKRTFAPDLIHLNAADATTFFHLTTANAFSAPTLLTLHGLAPDQGSDDHSVLIKMLQTADWVTCCSSAVLDEALRLAPHIASRSSVIHNAWTPGDLSPAPLRFDEPRLLCLGRLSREKGVDLAVEAFAVLARRFPEIRLVIAGDGPERQALADQAAGLGVSDRVDFVGWVAPDDVAALIEKASIVLVPSRWEGFGLVALEAAVMGRPVVATNVGGLPEVVKNNETGILVPVDEIDELVKAVEHLLTNPDRAIAMGAAARRHAMQAFNWSNHVEAYDRIYRRLIGEVRV